MKTTNCGRDFIYFKYFWLLVLLPKWAQLFALILIYMMMVPDPRKWRFHSSVIWFMLAAVVQFFAIFSRLLIDEFDLARTLAAVNTAMLWPISCAYFSFFISNRYSSKDMSRLLSYVSFNFCLFCLLYCLSLAWKSDSISILGHPYYLRYQDYLDNESLGEIFTSGSATRFGALMETKLAPAHWFISELPLLALGLIFMKRKTWLILLGFAAYIGVIASHSRAGLLMATVSMFGYCLMYVSLKFNIKLKRGYFLVFAVAVLFAFCVALNYKRIYSMFKAIYDMRAGSSASRALLYRNTIKKVLFESPLIGFGIKYLDPKTQLPYGSHSTYLGLFFKTGVLGSTLYFVAFFTILKRIKKSLGTLPTVQQQAMFLMMLAYFGLMIFADIDGTDWVIIGVFSVWGILIGSRSAMMENCSKIAKELRAIGGG